MKAFAIINEEWDPKWELEIPQNECPINITFSENDSKSFVTVTN